MEVHQMLKVVAKNELKDGTKDKALEMLEEMIELTRQEDGCISYVLFEDINNPNIITFIEAWEDEDKLKAHMNSEHFKRIIPQVNKLKLELEPANVYKKIR